jgi:hypothetical protein
VLEWALEKDLSTLVKNASDFLPLTSIRHKLVWGAINEEEFHLELGGRHFEKSTLMGKKKI